MTRGGFSRWTRLRWWWDTRVSVTLFELALYVLLTVCALFVFWMLTQVVLLDFNSA